MRAIIFGANGQDGVYLKLFLEMNRLQVLTISRSGNHILGDISNYTFVEEQVKKYSPDFIFHFAASSTTRHSAQFENHDAISTGALNVLEAVRLNAADCKVFLSGSAMQFKNTGSPIDEETEFEASSAYSVSRIHSVYLARYYRSKFGTKVYIGYFFNHDSPLRTEQHINQKIAKAVLRIANGSKEQLELGNISVRKEFGFAGDYVEAIWKLVNQDGVFEAVIGTGLAYSIEDWLQICFERVGKDYKEYVVLKEGFVAEYDVLFSKPSLMNSLGWYPTTSIYYLAEIMLQ